MKGGVGAYRSVVCMACFHRINQRRCGFFFGRIIALTAREQVANAVFPCAKVLSAPQGGERSTVWELTILGCVDKPVDPIRNRGNRMISNHAPDPNR